MSETLNTYINPEKKLPLQESKSFVENTESFTINAEEAAEILGVNRSRLSQLTSKGVFTFERRKIETRNRLFYKLSDLLNHQRSQFQDYSQLNSQYVEKTIKQQKQELDNQSEINNLKEEVTKNFKRNFNANKNHTSNIKNLNSAKTLYLEEAISNENINTKNNISFIKDIIIKQGEMIEKLKLQNIKNENTFLKNIKETHNSISNTQHSISLLNREIKILNELNHSLNFKINTVNTNLKNEPAIKSAWKKKKAKYTAKLTTSR